VQQLLEELSNALAEYAGELESAAGLSSVATTSADLPADLGKRQREVVELLRARAGEDGLKTAEVARAIDMEQPNTYLTLQALAKRGVAEMVPGVEPQHWRLAPRYRQSHRIIEVAELVRRGEWTSYGDISQAVYGHARGGMAVGSVARSAGFPHPHRVLQYTGQIPAEWIDQEGRGSAYCAELLRSEGVEVDGDLFAHGRHHVTHEELARRLKSARQQDAAN
jgi:alkylated DNA nucleotide flippase Atl1